mmetsp:Transcript_63375/g.180095  ORF Transcript_63375/g.180095 Transcript_63375/m.180095 type:complete len:256 (-) Transcript_63375:203-970(-)
MKRVRTERNNDPYRSSSSPVKALSTSPWSSMCEAVALVKTVATTNRNTHRITMKLISGTIDSLKETAMMRMSRKTIKCRKVLTTLVKRISLEMRNTADWTHNTLPSEPEHSDAIVAKASTMAPSTTKVSNKFHLQHGENKNRSRSANSRIDRSTAKTTQKKYIGASKALFLSWTPLLARSAVISVSHAMISALREISTDTRDSYFQSDVIADSFFCHLFSGRLERSRVFAHMCLVWDLFTTSVHMPFMTESASEE